MKLIRVGDQIVSLENVLEVFPLVYGNLRIRYKDNPSREASVIIDAGRKQKEILEQIYEILAK